MRRALAVVIALAACAGCGGSRQAAPDRDVSRALDSQAEVALAAGRRVLLGSSIDFGTGSLRTYTSRDGGETWTTTAGPGRTPNGCGGDPAPAIGADGHELIAFLRSVPCARHGRATVVVARRRGPHGPWTEAPVAPPSPARSEDKPDIAVDLGARSPHRGRVYVDWTSAAPQLGTVLRLAWSDDGGAMWSRPVRVNAPGGLPYEASIAVAADGAVYLAWLEVGETGDYVARSTDGGRTFSTPVLVGVSLQTAARIRRCTTIGRSIPAQPRRCPGANPVVTVDPRDCRVYVTYTGLDDNGSDDVYVTALTPALRPLLGYPVPKLVGPPDGAAPSDQFRPASAVDPRDGALWVCFYDTRSHARIDAIYGCTASFDGGRTWARPVAAASVPSNEVQPGAERFEYGDYEGLAVAGGVAHPMWTDSRLLSTLGEEIYTASIPESRLR